jgi:glucose-1-phosphate cytidylyltransferase
MKYYASYGHKDFIICLGYKADVIKNYFLNYSEALSNDFVLDGEGGVELLGRDMRDWRITFVDTGLHSNIGTRLMKVRHLVEDEDMFLANYSDGLSDFPLPMLIERFERSDATASFLAVRPTSRFHVVNVDEGGSVESIEDLSRTHLRINGGFFAMRPEIFDYMRPGEEMVEEPFRRLIEARRLLAYPYDGFWTAMDTFKDKQQLDELYEAGNPPWEVRAAPDRVLVGV